ncbi:MAG: response regulator [Beijerinckiaceae bacterium]
MTDLRNAPTSPHILIVEDDEDISALIARYLASHEIRASIAAHGQEMECKLAQNRIDLIILDLNLPKEDGLSLCLRLRKTRSVPIIMLTARGEEVDRIVGLEMGADDYLVKPFNPRELLARIRAVLRRQGGPREERLVRIFRFAGWQIDRGLRQVVNPNGAKVTLTGAEFDLMVAFCENAGRVLSRDQLLQIVHGDSASTHERSVDILVSRLRQKIEVNSREPEMIKTVRSGGYVLSQSIEAE